MKYTRDIIILFILVCILLGATSCAYTPMRYSDKAYQYYYAHDIVPILNNELMEYVAGMYELDRYSLASYCGGFQAVGCVISVAPHKYNVYMRIGLSPEEKADVILHEMGHIHEVEYFGLTYEQSSLHGRNWWGAEQLGI